MLTFVGEGYTPAFTENYRRIAKRLSAGEEIELVAGPDDICAPLMEGADPHCLDASVVERDAAAREAVARLLGHEIASGSIIAPDLGLLLSLRRNFASGKIRQACEGCEWDGLCTAIAGDGYQGTLVSRN
jgi:hypothetical protein